FHYITHTTPPSPYPLSLHDALPISLWFITANTMGHSAFRAKRSVQASFFRLKLWSVGCKTSAKILRQDSSSAGSYFRQGIPRGAVDHDQGTAAAFSGERTRLACSLW